MPARKRYWLDLDRELTEAYLSGMSYRQVKAMVEQSKTRLRREASHPAHGGLWILGRGEDWLPTLVA